MTSVQNADVVVAGAGIFGASTALALLDAGIARVVLLDAWGAGNPRATSSGESRVIRAAYGDNCIYSRWAWEALGIYRQWEQEWGRRFLIPAGVLWLAGADTAFASASVECLRGLGVPVETWDSATLAARYPQFVNLDNRPSFFEPEACAVLARQVCLAAVEMFRRRGGIIEKGEALAPDMTSDPADAIHLSDGRRLSAGAFVYACGPWLRGTFPELLRDRVKITRQEVFFFGTPAGTTAYDAPNLPIWIEEGDTTNHGFSFYGIPSVDGRGLKIACDERGPEFDPTHGDRSITPEGLAAARRYLALRFPAMSSAPLVESRVCQYEQTPDSHLILDRHPHWNNVWIAGGSSGHGFKLGPRVGRCMAECIVSNSSAGVPEPLRM